MRIRSHRGHHRTEGVGMRTSIVVRDIDPGDPSRPRCETGPAGVSREEPVRRRIRETRAKRERQPTRPKRSRGISGRSTASSIRRRPAPAAGRCHSPPRRRHDGSACTAGSTQMRSPKGCGRVRPAGRRLSRFHRPRGAGHRFRHRLGDSRRDRPDRSRPAPTRTRRPVPGSSRRFVRGPVLRVAGSGCAGLRADHGGPTPARRDARQPGCGRLPRRRRGLPMTQSLYGNY